MDSEAIAMKMISTTDRLKSRTPKAIQDFDDAMKMVFNSFWPKYKEAKEEAGEKEGDRFYTEEQWKVFLKID